MLRATIMQITKDSEAFLFKIKINMVYSESSQTSKIKLFGKVVNSFQPLIIFAKKLHLRCLTEF